MKKEKEFNFDEAYNSIMEQAKRVGMDNDMVFQTQMKEFKRMKIMCDRLWESIEHSEVAYIEVGTKGQDIFKSNPLNKEYVSAHKTLISTSQAIKETLAKVGTDGDWL